MCLFTRGENLPRREKRIERGRETRVDGHLNEDFDNLLLRAPHVQRRDDVHFQLGLSIAEGRERGDRRNLA